MMFEINQRGIISGASQYCVLVGFRLPRPSCFVGKSALKAPVEFHDLGRYRL